MSPSQHCREAATEAEGMKDHEHDIIREARSELAVLQANRLARQAEQAAHGEVLSYRSLAPVAASAALFVLSFTSLVSR